MLRVTSMLLYRADRRHQWNVDSVRLAKSYSRIQTDRVLPVLINILIYREKRLI